MNSSVPPFDLHSQLGEIFENKDLADVTFEVDGQSFDAHKLILAVRSPVFKAAFFGEMAEAKQPQQIMKIDDMKGEVFAAMLHYIYTDSFPHYDEDGEGEGEDEESDEESDEDDGDVDDDDVDDDADDSNDSKMTSIIMAQHLFVAADRYVIEGLKRICVEKLCENVTGKTISAALALAEQHDCGRLRGACMEFLAEPGRLLCFLLTDEYVDMIRNFPSLLVEIKNMVKNAPSFKKLNKY